MTISDIFFVLVNKIPSGTAMIVAINKAINEPKPIQKQAKFRWVDWGLKKKRQNIIIPINRIFSIAANNMIGDEILSSPGWIQVLQIPKGKRLEKIREQKYRLRL